MGATNSGYLRSPNLGIMTQFPASPLSSPLLPSSPVGGMNHPGRRNEMRFPQGSVRNAGVYSGWQGQRGLYSLEEPKRHSFLKELKSSNARKFELSDIAGRIVEFRQEKGTCRSTCRNDVVFKFADVWLSCNPEVDIISAIEFDRTGDHLAIGDRGVRVVLFERTDTRDHGGHWRELERMDYSNGRHPEFRYKTEFQSHEPEFDYLKSLEIEEKINKIRWCQAANGALFLLSTNDKTIKFWKVQEKKVEKVCDLNMDLSRAMRNGPAVSSSISASSKSCMANGGCDERSSGYSSIDTSLPSGGLSSLQLPMVTSHETSLVARCRRIYAHAHHYHINSILNNSDGETFISTDDLRINLWNLEISNQSFNIVDVKLANMEDLTEVITSTEFHPTHCNTLAYSSSRGSIRLIDMRQSALCDTHSKLFEELEVPGTRSFFTEIIASISDIKFAKDGRHILSRDYIRS
ncbi:hypothetical protein ACB098_06G064700 [Castanea mollissima]